ncbi:MAG TPA: hypothetical protein VH988_27495 [Thermoanaerobaculia bacterium]|jgi:hypothetical protein|nr:hypothetical protein [Thermoanaerobaculia bacterium]
MNPSLTDILVIVDTATLATLVADGTLQPGTVNNPQPLNEQAQSSVLVTLMAQGSFVSNTSEGVLVVGANSQSQLRWAISGLDSNAAFTPYFCRGLFVYHPATFGLPQFSRLVIDNGVPTVMYIPSSTDPQAKPKKVTNTTQQSKGPTIGAGDRLWAFLEINVIDNSTGGEIGYFGWAQSLSVESVPVDPVTPTT